MRFHSLLVGVDTGWNSQVWFWTDTQQEAEFNTSRGPPQQAASSLSQGASSTLQEVSSTLQEVSSAPQEVSPAPYSGPDRLIYSVTTQARAAVPIPADRYHNFFYLHNYRAWCRWASPPDTRQTNVLNQRLHTLTVSPFSSPQQHKNIDQHSLYIIRALSVD